MDNPVGGELWNLWRQLKRLFPTWNLIPSSFYTPGALGYLGVDFITGLRRNPSTIAADRLLKDVDDPTFAGVAALADLNLARQDQLLKFVILTYLTVPISFTALMAEIYGSSLLAFVDANRQTAISLVAIATLSPLGYMMSQWRARQIVSVLELLRIERLQKSSPREAAGDPA
ncbi:hypothetical protein [Brevundimonas sp. R86498]|uniref:hypothetical protein n=1 Tax=Brevundimonas sp. R86498 TaxID=3093845 RepID=UPI0037C89B43